MIDALQRTTLLALYQLSIAIGIALLPIAILARQGGITIPIHRLVERIGQAYEQTQTSQSPNTS